MQRQFRYDLNDLFCTLAVERDIDNCCPVVVVTADRRSDDLIQLSMDSTQARLLAKRLNEFARMIDPPKPRRTQAR